ncbi:O-antigen ligase family protein [Neobacillus sp. NPDC058068]|uniref:O-antigen ligase family protein n=1 Tax=Neobacillus sp. NPDC058068 TaxID=3346325 RepID=UPI0036DEE7EE
MLNLNGMRRILNGLLSFEMCFTLFLFAGSYKANPSLAWFPIDFTLFFFGLSIFSGLNIFIWKEKLKVNIKDLKFILLFSVFAGYVLLTLLWTPGTVYAREKVFFVCTILSWTIAATTIIISSTLERLKRFLFLCVLFGTWMSVEGLFVNVNKGGFTDVLGGNYIEFSRVLGLAAIILTYILLFIKRNKWTKFFIAFLLLFMLFNILNAGARGPLLALIISLFPILFYGSFIRNRSFKLHVSVIYVAAASFIGMLYIGLLYFTNNLPTALLRIMVIFQEQGMGASAATRLEYYNQSLLYWKENLLFGNGIGAWPLLHDGMDIKNYPHNIILELGSELGLIGIILFVFLHLYIIRDLHAANKSFSFFSLLLTSILIFYFINSLISGDINENRYYFAFLGVSIFVMKNFKQKVIIENQNNMREFQ